MIKASKELKTKQFQNDVGAHGYPPMAAEFDEPGAGSVGSQSQHPAGTPSYHTHQTEKGYIMVF